MAVSVFFFLFPAAEMRALINNFLKWLFLHFFSCILLLQCC